MIVSGDTYRTVGKIALTLLGVKHFAGIFLAYLSRPRLCYRKASVDATEVRLYKVSYRTVGKWISI
jgi:hypothetical protein